MDTDKEFALKVAVASTLVYMAMIKFLPSILENQEGMLGEIRDFLASCEDNMINVSITVLVATICGTLIVTKNT